VEDEVSKIFSFLVKHWLQKACGGTCTRLWHEVIIKKYLKIISMNE
jgi:hypothetical protein